MPTIPVQFASRSGLPSLGGSFYQTNLPLIKIHPITGRRTTKYYPSSDVLYKLLNEYAVGSESLWEVFALLPINQKFPKSALMLVLAVECSYIFYASFKEKQFTEIIGHIREGIFSSLNPYDTKHITVLFALLSYLLVALHRNIEQDIKCGTRNCMDSTVGEFIMNQFGIMGAVTEQYEGIFKLIGQLQLMGANVVAAKGKIETYLQGLVTTFFKANISDISRIPESAYNDTELHNDAITGTHHVIQIGAKIGFNFVIQRLAFRG